jgi:hypothetical protein
LKISTFFFKTLLKINSTHRYLSINDVSENILIYYHRIKNLATFGFTILELESEEISFS